MDKINRPIIITIVCIAGYIGVVISFPGIFSPFIKKLGDFYPALFGFIIAGNFISLVGVWNMKRWGFHSFLFFTICNQIAHLLVNDWKIMSIIFPLVFLLVSGFYFRRMKEDL